MGHGGGVAEQRLHAAQALGERPQLERADQLAYAIEAALELHAYDRAEPRSLAFREFVLRVTCKSRVNDARNFRMTLQEARDCQRIRGMTFDSQCQRLDSAQQQEAILWPGRGSRCILHEFEGIK